MFRVSHGGEGIDDADTLEVARGIDNDCLPRIARRIIVRGVSGSLAAG
jgi:hypothetical protein